MVNKEQAKVDANGSAKRNPAENEPLVDDAAKPSESVARRTTAREKAYKTDVELPTDEFGPDQFKDGGLSSTAEARQERVKKTVGDASQEDHYPVWGQESKDDAKKKNA